MDVLEGILERRFARGWELVLVEGRVGCGVVDEEAIGVASRGRRSTRVRMGGHGHYPLCRKRLFFVSFLITDAVGRYCRTTLGCCMSGCVCVFLQSPVDSEEEEQRGLRLTPTYIGCSSQIQENENE